MFRNAWFTLGLGLIFGFAVGFVIGEGQQVRPNRLDAGGAMQTPQGLPEGHPPIPDESGSAGDARNVEQDVEDLLARLAQNPDDPRLMVGLANVHFDASRWHDARMWYERAREIEIGDANVTTDLAVVYRNLERPEKALALLDEAIRQAPDHWQSWYNRVVILHFDLHRHEEAEEAFERLKEIGAANPQVPDLSLLEADIKGH